MAVEIFHADQDDNCPGIPSNGTLLQKTTNQQWQPCGADGFWIKPLLEEAGSENHSAVRTWLMKVDAGAWSPDHSHEQTEQIYVLEGSFYDAEQEYGPGDFVVRAPGAMHTAGSKQGAIVLLVYT